MSSGFQPVQSSLRVDYDKPRKSMCENSHVAVSEISDISCGPTREGLRLTSPVNIILLIKLSTLLLLDILCIFFPTLLETWTRHSGFKYEAHQLYRKKSLAIGCILDH